MGDNDNDQSDRSTTEQLADAASSVARTAQNAVRNVADQVQDAVAGLTIPGAPGSEPPTVEEPTAVARS